MGIPEPSRTSGTTFGRSHRLRLAMQFVQDNLSTPVRLEDVARVADLSRNYFSFYFRDRVGVRFSDWLATLRVAQAEILLSTTQLDIDQVAALVGCTPRTLQRQFQRNRQTTPTAYRRRQQSAVAVRQPSRLRKTELRS